MAHYLDNNRLIAHYCGFDIMKPLPSYWTYDCFLRQMDHAELKSVMAGLVRQLYEQGTLSHISALAIALAAVLSGSHSYRAPKSFRRGA